MTHFLTQLYGSLVRSAPAISASDLRARLTDEVPKCSCWVGIAAYYTHFGEPSGVSDVKAFTYLVAGQLWKNYFVDNLGATIHDRHPYVQGRGCDHEIGDAFRLLAAMKRSKVALRTFIISHHSEAADRELRSGTAGDKVDGQLALALDLAEWCAPRYSVFFSEGTCRRTCGSVLRTLTLSFAGGGLLHLGDDLGIESHWGITGICLPACLPVCLKYRLT